MRAWVAWAVLVIAGTGGVAAAATSVYAAGQQSKVRETQDIYVCLESKDTAVLRAIGREVLAEDLESRPDSELAAAFRELDETTRALNPQARCARVLP